MILWGFVYWVDIHTSKMKNIFKCLRGIGGNSYVSQMALTLVLIHEVNIH